MMDITIVNLFHFIVNFNINGVFMLLLCCLTNGTNVAPLMVQSCNFWTFISLNISCSCRTVRCQLVKQL